MACLYRLNDEICIELSYEAVDAIRLAVIDNLPYYTPALQSELNNFANMVRAHLQHPEPASKPAPSNNMDLA